MTTSLSEVAADLRAWAAGAPAVEAAVDLLVAALGGRFARPGNPWIRRGRDGYWFDVDELAEQLPGPWSGGERRVLAVVASLAGGPPVDLCDVLNVDDDVARLVVTAIPHAAGVRR